MTFGVRRTAAVTLPPSDPRGPSNPPLEGEPSHSDSRSESESGDGDPGHQHGEPEPDMFEAREPVPVDRLNQQPVGPATAGKYDPNR